MADAVDAYADHFQLLLGPYGSALTFGLTPSSPPATGQPMDIRPVATIRMSLEHLKVVAYVLHRNLLDYERSTGTEVAVPRRLMESLGITPEEWTKLWAA